MTYAVSVDSDRQYITVVTDGPITVKEMGVMGREFVKREMETGIRRVLIDIRKSRVHANIIDAFTYTSSSQIPILTGEKNAILIEHGSRDEFLVRMYVMQSMFSGLHTRMFTSERDAMEWLLR